MAGPLSGIGGYSGQIPLSNTFKPGQDSTTQQVRPENENQAKPNIAQTASTEIGQVQNSETGNQGNLQNLARELLDSVGDNNQSARRGSILDIQV